MYPLNINKEQLVSAKGRDTILCIRLYILLHMYILYRAELS